MARYLRIIPNDAGSNFKAMRAEIYGCFAEELPPYNGRFMRLGQITARPALIPLIDLAYLRRSHHSKSFVSIITELVFLAN